MQCSAGFLELVTSVLEVQRPHLLAKSLITLYKEIKRIDARKKGLSPAALSLCNGWIIYSEFSWPDI